MKRYSDDGIIWYFDNFAMDSASFYRTLIQFREAGWFKNTKGVIVGRVMYPSDNFDDFTYQDALKKIFGDIPIIFNADVGHVCPKMTMINGALVDIMCDNEYASIKFTLE